MAKKKINTAPMLSKDQIAENYKKQQDNKTKSTTAATTAAKPKINGVESGIMLSYDRILNNWLDQQGDKAASTITALYNKTKERNNLQTRGLPLYDKKGNMVAVPIADHTAYGRKKEREIQRLWEELTAKEDRRTGNVELGSWLGTGTSNNKAKEALDTRNAREYIDWFTGSIASGNYNNTGDVTQMNQEGLNSYLNQLQQSQKDLESRLAENQRSIDTQGKVDRTLPMLSLVDNDRTRNEWAIINGEGYTEQEKAKARETLEQLWNVGSAANPSAKTLADTYLKYIDNIDGAGSTPERMRQMAYDAMNGNGAYEKVTGTMQAADKKALDDKIDNALAYIRDPNGQLGIDRRTMESELRTVMDDIKETQRQQQIWNDYNALMNLVPQGQNAEYVQENDVMKNYDYWTPSRQTGDLDAWAYTPNADMIYSFINGGYAWQQYTAGGYREVSGIMKYAELMNSAEVDQFNKFYNAGQKNEAMAFLDGLQSALSQRYVTQYETLSTQMRARQFPITTSIMTFGDTLMQPAEFVYNLVSSIFNNDSKNPYSGNYFFTRNKAVTREQVGKDLGPVGKFFYDAAMSGGDSALNLAIGKCMGLTGKPLEAATLTLFSTQAFQTSMQRNLEESNGDFGYSFLEATVDSLIETATEIASLEALIGDPTNLIQYVLKTAAAEGSEEFVGAAFGPYVKEMLGRKNEWKTRADQILKAGGYDDGYGNFVKVNSYDEAARQAMREWNHDIVISTLSGAVSTGGGVFYGTARNIYNRAQTGRQIISPDNIKNGMSGAEQILKIAGGMKEGSQSKAYADAIAKKTEKGKTPSNYEIGRLAETVWQETGEAQREVVGEITQRSVREQLVKEGVPAAEAEQYAALISGSLTGSRKLSRGDVKTLAKSESAMKVWLSYNTATEENKALNREIREATAGQRSIENTLMDLTGATAKQQSVIAGEVEQSIKETNSQEEAIDNLAQRRSELMSEDYAKLAKDLYKTEQKSKASSRYLDDIMKIRLAAMSMNQLPRTGLSQENAQKLYEAAQKEFEEKDKARIKHNVILEPGKGTATFDDAEFGTDEWKEKLRSLNSNQRAQVNVLAEVARRMGMRMEFVNDPTQSGNWGWQTKETGVVTVNVAGKYSKTGLSHNMLVTMSHELTHWLEHNSVEGYNQLRQYAVDSLRRKGVNVEALMISSIDNQNLARNTAKENNVKGWERIEVLDLNGAMAEVVARSCENLLGSKAFAKEVEETNPTLFKHIQNYIKNFMVRLREAVKGMRTSLSYEATALLNETEKIAEIWLGARGEAMGRKITAEPTLTLDEAMASPVVVFSLNEFGMEELTEGQKKAILENKDIFVETGEQLLEEIHKARTQKNYKKNIFIGCITENTKRMLEREANDHNLFTHGEYIFGFSTDEIRHFDKHLKTDEDIALALFDAYKMLKINDEVTPIRYKDGRLRIKIVYNNNVLELLSITELAKEKRYATVTTIYQTLGKIESWRALDRQAMLRSIHSSTRGASSKTKLTQNRTNGKSFSMEQTAEALQKDLELNNGPETHYGDHQQFSVEVKDPEELAFLNKQKTVITYKTMQLINGKLYPPMAAVVDGSMEDASQLGHWEKATEHPELIKNGNQFALNKGGGKGSVNAAYNPYMHSSDMMINDQFTGAYDRSNLVTVECEVPVSELTSGYHAEYAKDSVGWHKWHTGTVAGQLRKQKGVERKVMLSRWIKPVRIISDEEVANKYKELIKGTDIQVPDNVVWPSLLEELKKAGVPIKESGRVQFSMEQLDQEYQEAVESGNLDRATEMLMDRLAKTEGIIPFNAPHGYSGQHRDIAKLIKEGTPEAVARAAADMAQFVPENGVLIPMPPHEGTVETDTDTMILANAISKLTGRPVVVALESDPRESRYQAKSEGRKGVTAAEMGFRKVKEIPEGTMPIFVDNVVGSGVTADAARTAMGGGITLAYAKGTQSRGIEGLKRATVTYDKDGKLIPLSQRFNRSIRNVNYSMEQLDEEYETARKAGDEDAMRRLVNEAANRAMKDSEARYDDDTLIPVMHGTNEEFNIFDTSKQGGKNGTAEGFGIYLTDRPEVSEKYGKRQIAGFLNAKRLAHGSEVTIKARELTDVIRATCEEQAREIAEEEGYDNWQDALRDTWISNYIYTPDYKNMNAAYRAVADQILKQTDNDNDIIREVMAGMGIREYDRAMDFYHRILTPITGIDGMWTEWKNYEDETIANIFLAFDSSQIKSADLVTYDDNGKPIPLSQRFNPENPDIRYSVEQGEDPQPITNDRGEEIAVLLPGNTVAATQYSLDSYYELGERKKMMDQLKKAGYTEKQIKKWIGDLDNIAAIIAGDRVRYDFVADRSKKFLKPNGDVYKKTLDASTMCKKTRLYNGTFNLVQHMMPHTIFMPEDLIDLFNIMKDENLETPCGFCYVQSRRRQLGPYTKEWLEKYKGEYIPTVDEVTTSDGLEKLKVEHPQTYKDFVAAMNKKGVNNPKLVQQRTDYRGDIRKLSKSTIEYLKAIGGLRIQSFSDFEVVHMLDMMQAVMDMKAVGLTAQAYTKVPEFAWIFGRTGIKINLSLVGKGTGLDADGNLVFDNDEGIDFNEAMKLREAYSKNVGTILVGINDDHIIAAMGDDRIDFIIPFHKSGWSKAELDRMRGLSAYQDYTETQNEYQWTINEDGERVLVKVDSNIDPLSYWNFKRDGTWNAERYLQECKKQGLVPKFSQFLVKNADGSYSLPQGNSQRDQNIRKGYWKTLIDFKMYDNDGVGAEQMPVEPNFNMEKAFEILEEYDGSHRQLPEDMKAAKKFVRNFKRTHPLDDVRTQYSMEQAPDMDVQAWMAGLTPGSLQTEDERALLQTWKDKRMSISLSIKRQLDYRAKIKRLENSADSLTPQEREDLVALRNKLQVQEEKQARLEKEMYQITSQEGFAGMMYQQNMVMRDFITGRTQDEINDTVDDMVHEVQRMAREIAATRKELEKLAEAEDLRNAQKALDGTDLNRNARRLKKDYRSRMTENEIQARLAEMALKLAAGGSMEDVAESARELAYDLGRLQNGYLGGAYGDLADRLKQVTIVIGPTQREQLNAQHSSIPNLRRQLAGSGVKIVFDPNLRGAGTLEDIGPGSEIHDLIPELGEDTGNMMNNLDVFVGLVQSTLKNLESEMLHDFDLDDAEMMIQGYALLASTELQGDPAMTTQVKRLLGLAKGEGGKAGELAERLKNAQDYLKGAIDKGEQAKGLTKMLRKDVDSAISYYNKTAAVAAKVEKQKVKEGLIAQLKSQHAQDLMKEQQKWRDLIEKDKTVRAMMQQNQDLRRGITSDYTRIRKLLVNETDQKNIPEHMKSLARHMIRLLTENDLIGRKITNVQRQDLMETLRILDAMRQTDDDFTLDDLRMISDEEAQAAVAEALADLEDGIKFYNASPGSDRISNLQAFHNALDRVSEAVMTITGVIGAEQSVSFMGRRQLVADAAGAVRADLGRSRFKGELAGRGAKALRTGKRAVVYGNTTPVYFFKNLLNRGMDMIWKDMEWSENRNGLEMQRAKDFVGALAARTGYSSWSGQKMKVTLGGMAREISIENVMEMCAIWKREHTTNPEMSQHLAKGGVYIAEDEDAGGKLRRENRQQRAWRVTDEEVAAMMEMLTPEQKEYMNGMVGYLSNEMSELGNEASMRMYGIKKYKEKYYFPMKVWDGVKSARSDKGITGTDENRAAHRSWSKRRINRARNALVIGNFTTDAVNHIVEMITYNTMAPAIENINKVLNYQFEEGANQDERTKRNLRIMFQEAYGKDALEYLETFMKDLNGGTVQDQRKTLRDRMLSVFKKNAVGGSLSVALQQPLSYIRAAMMINPKYMAQALNPTYWKGSHAEMVKYSGVAVIKDMGRFDMNFGQSAKDYVTPEGAMSKGRAVYEWISDKTTILPELMDRMTWTRMWSAVKAEQKAQNPEMDPKSDEFLQKVAERFNEVMRRTQVYDSVMVKSSNMRSQNLGMKVLTSFMAEPTLTLNVLADAVRNVNQAGGKAMLAKAGGTFVLSAVVQAVVKALMGTGRSPDKKKTAEENFLNKFVQSLLGEIDPLSLIPGYSDVIEVLKTGELKDDAMGALGKIFSVVDVTQKAIQGKGNGAYRDLEDTVGQLAQLFTNVPAKNLMRDARAMFNWFIERPYAERATSGAVVRQQTIANLTSADNLIGVINKWLGQAGYQTTNAAYYDRMWKAREAGNEGDENEIREFLTEARGVTEKTITTEMRKRMKGSDVLTPEEKIQGLREDGVKDTDIANWVLDEYDAGNLTRSEAEKLYLQANPKKDKDDAYFLFERKEAEEKSDGAISSTDYFRLNDAIDRGDVAAAKKAGDELTAHGYSADDVSDHAKDYITKQYREGKLTNRQATDALKTFRKDMDAVEIFWVLDRIDFKKETGKSAGSGKYYRLDAAIEANKAEEIRRAVNDMTSKGGFDKDGVLKGIRYFKKTYLAASGQEKIRLRDALTKAFKAAGMSADQATAEIDGWKETKKKTTKKKK